MKNSWNLSFPKEDEKSPKQVLLIQANYLSKKTGSLILGSVNTVLSDPSNNDFLEEDEDFKSDCFIHSFIISIPSLLYSFTLLRLIHQTIQVFPFKVCSDLTDYSKKGNSIDDLECILKDILSSDKVNNVIYNLIIQTK